MHEFLQRCLGDFKEFVTSGITSNFHKAGFSFFHASSRACRSFFSFLAAGAFLLLAALLVGEIAVRIFVSPNRWKFRDATSDWVIDRRLGWVQKQGLDVTTQTEEGWTVRFRTNEDGLTPPTARRRKQQGTLRVLFFGNSTVVGRGVPQDQTVSAQLENILRKNEVRAEVLNAGVQGYSTDQVLLHMGELLPIYQPDIVFYGACDNDFGGNVSRKAYGQTKPTFRFKKGGALEEIPPDFQSKVNSFGQGAGKWLQHSALYRFFQPSIVTLRARMGRWEERNLLGLAPEIYYQPESLERINWALFSSLVKKMKRAAGENRARFFFYSHPAIAEVWDPYIEDTERRLKLKADQYDRYALERRYKEVADKTGTHFIPLIDYFKIRQSQGPFHLLPRDPHSNPAGHRLTAEALEEFIIHSLKEFVSK